ncbi:MAG: TraM recognition domain-containing protein [Deltaproteobacteria bacterium]|nr:TraM recognition domain-containing protein [Deltaproteobacteria bacterium]
MPQPPIRGLSPDDSTDRQKLRRDIRSPLLKRLKRIGRTQSTVMALAVLTILELSFPQSALFWISLLWLLLYLHYKESKNPLAIRLPKGANRLDPNSPGPGHKFWNQADGTILVGHDIINNQEIWITENDLLTHILLLGTTGSGKTESLLSLAGNAMSGGSGLFYIDPKAAPLLAVQLWQMVRILGRDDDFRVLNYGAADHEAGITRRISNTNNPFSEGSADALTQILTSLMPNSAESDRNNIFADKARNLIAGLLQVLVDLRDKGDLRLSVGNIRGFLNLEVCVQLLNNAKLEESSKAALKAALQSCNWVESRSLDQQNSFYEQFGYAQSYFGRALSSLTDTYGHIYGAEYGEVDFRDVVLNRRILLVLLPSLEKSPAELASLGKITLSSLKAAAAVGLGLDIEGPESDVLGPLHVHFEGSGPFQIIVDEYAAIVTPGFEMVLTQGRGLGIGSVIASQDYAGLIEADRKGAQQIVANTNLKIFMKLAEPEKTWNLLKSLSGEEPVLRTTGYNLNREHITSAWQDNQTATVEMSPVSVLRDLMEQTEGEAHCVCQGQVIRARLLYVNINVKDALLRVPRLVYLDGSESDD